ncbi:MAG: CRISPR-associated helicase Cas3' [Desulfurococcaceae archaeon]
MAEPSGDYYRRFFKLVTGFEPYEWQVEVAERLFELEEKGGVLILRAETGSGKTEASVLPGLFHGKQVIVVEPYRALIEDMVVRFKKYLAKLSGTLGVKYTLGVDYGGRHYIYECTGSNCTERLTRKPFGADVLVTTIDEMVYRVLSVGTPRKASLYTSLVKTGRPVVFFDEAHSYASEAFNPLVTLVHLTASLSIYIPVVIATATLPKSVEEHLELVVSRNGVSLIKVNAPVPEVRPPKARVELDLRGFKTPDEQVEAIVKHVDKYVEKGFRKILVRVVTPDSAYSVYTRLLKLTSKGYNVGVLHGRMPIYDRERVYRAVRDDVSRDENVILVSTSVIEAGVDLDFDAGVLELTPYRSLEQTMGRVNRRYTKKNSEVTVVNTPDSTWALLENPKYLEEARLLLAVMGSGVEWSKDLSPKLKEIDERYTRDKLSPLSLVDAYDSPYSRILAVSLYSLFHLEGTFLEHLLALSEKEYETRGTLDVAAEVEGESGNIVRVPYSIAKDCSIYATRTVPKELLKDHSYTGKTGKVEVRGLVDTEQLRKLCREKANQQEKRKPQQITT